MSFQWFCQVETRRSVNFQAKRTQCRFCTKAISTRNKTTFDSAYRYLTRIYTCGWCEGNRCIIFLITHDNCESRQNVIIPEFKLLEKIPENFWILAQNFEMDISIIISIDYWPSVITHSRNNALIIRGRNDPSPI